MQYFGQRAVPSLAWVLMSALYQCLKCGPGILRFRPVPGMQWASPKKQYYPMLCDCKSSDKTLASPDVKGLGSLLLGKRWVTSSPNFSSFVSSDYLQIPGIAVGCKWLLSEAALGNSDMIASISFAQWWAGDWEGPPEPSRTTLHPILAPGLPSLAPWGQHSL